ncbi:alpha/beta hydrolase [Nocardia goodfellowii]|uniref:Fermentation-respiration switch protein FrsA (DUF1100 family) n=1 Tax=Nocardia goodfellowii TaxID=882446 RepID=A0ABS4QLJ0_9NOCA|nr:alpha/beta fold hydrolase [Nocardia goodfellowii]MBP2191546.1 fermentation-respiration switch protein FrsA (DUF1100 family) [Nocardia goodfellowii]
MRTETVSFRSEGSTVEGDIYLPDDPGIRLPHAAVVLAQGFTGTRTVLVPAYAAQFAHAGVAALTFDYRGFGGSDGERHRLLPAEQIDDIRNAITYMTTRPDIDGNRIALWGTSFGAAHAMYVGGVDTRVRAVVAQAGFGDGAQLLFDSRTEPERRALTDAIDHNRRCRVRGEPEARVDPAEILHTAQARAFSAVMLQQLPELACELSWQTAEKTLEYRPIDVVARMAPRALLLIAAADDDLCRADRLQAVFQAANEPKRFLVIDTEHAGLYAPDQLLTTARAAVDFFHAHL